MDLRATAPPKCSIFDKVKKLTLVAENDAEYLELAILFKALRQGRVRLTMEPVKDQGEETK